MEDYELPARGLLYILSGGLDIPPSRMYWGLPNEAITSFLKFLFSNV
jgi:hypothetical protein